jgi:hypothetical protein
VLLFSQLLGKTVVEHATVLTHFAGRFLKPIVPMRGVLHRAQLLERPKLEGLMGENWWQRGPTLPGLEFWVELSADGAARN